MRKTLLAVIVVIVAMLSCKSKETPLPVNEMKLIMWDMMKADQWFNAMNAKDSIAMIKKEDLRLYQQVFLIHGVTKDRFYKSYEYYEAHPGEMKTLVDSIDAYSIRERERWFENNHGQKK